MKRILIIGCSGAGKTSLALELSRRLRLPLCHLDKLWWIPGWKTVTRDVFDARLAVELRKPSWIIDGDYSRTFAERLKFADTVIFLQYPRIVCLAGALSRIIKMHGKVRVDMSEGCPERFDFEFLKYIWNFNRNEIPKLESALKSFNGRLIRLKSRRETKSFLALKECVFVTPSFDFQKQKTFDEQIQWALKRPMKHVKPDPPKPGEPGYAKEHPKTVGMQGPESQGRLSSRTGFGMRRAAAGTE